MIQLNDITDAADDERNGRADDHPMLGDTPPRRLTDDELGGRAALEAKGLYPVDGWDDERLPEHDPDGQRRSKQPCARYVPYESAPGYCQCGWMHHEHSAEATRGRPPLPMDYPLRPGQALARAQRGSASPAPTRERMAEIAKRPRRPAVTPLRAKGIEKIADLVRHRLKLRSGLYAIHADDKDAVKAALEYLDELALFHRRHR